MFRCFRNGRVPARACVRALNASFILTIIIVVEPAVQANDPPLSEVGQWVDPPCAPSHPTGQDCSDWSTYPYSGGLRPEDAFLMPDGKVFLRWRCNPHRHFVWDPATGVFTQKTHQSFGVDVAGCPGLAPMVDGRVMVAGGVCTADCSPPNATPYLDWAAVYDFRGGGSWSQLTPMNEDRWYPTITLLPSGNLLATGGRTGCNPAPPSGDPSIYDVKAETWSTWGGTPISTVFGTNQVNYPRVFVLPDDPRLFVTLSRRNSTDAFLLHLPNESWDNADSTGWAADRDSAVMYRPGKVLRSGGRSGGEPHEPHADTEHIDLSGPDPEQAEWDSLPPMNRARWSHDLVVLPDGKVVAIGGVGEKSDPVFHAEWIDMDAQTPQWEELADSIYPRIYHSAALLLPDATILATGGNSPVGTAWEDMNFSGDIFEPPYLFDGDNYAPRPIIETVPNQILYDERFCVQLSEGDVEADDIAQVTLLRTGAVTHGFDPNQRFVRLTRNPIADVENNRLNVPAPANPKIAPPGYYMLFLISRDGVPSKAKFVQLLSECPENPCPADLTGNGHVGGADLAALLSQWGPCADCDDCPADLNGDCAVGSADLAILLSSWGPCDTCGGDCPPEVSPSNPLNPLATR